MDLYCLWGHKESDTTEQLSHSFQPWFGASQVAQWVKDLPAMQEMKAYVISIPGSGRSPGGGHGNPLQYSLLENPMERGAWWGTVQSQKESDTIEATEHTCALGLICLCFT